MLDTLKYFAPEPLLFLYRRLFRRANGERILRDRFRAIHGHDLDTTNVTTFSEKLYRRMIEVNREGNETFTHLADKFTAREYVARTAGAKHLIPLLWSSTSTDEIPFDSLPERCFVKTNHGSGGGMLLHPGINRNEVIATLREMLNQNFYWPHREYQYYHIRPRILIEQLIDDGKPFGPLDYRFWCFHGEPRAIQVDNHAHTLNAFYSPSWKLTGATYRSTAGIREAERPENLEALMEVAAKLSAPFDFVRVDLYSANGHSYFGEMTFTPTAGQNKFDPPDWDRKFGEMWR